MRVKIKLAPFIDQRHGVTVGRVFETIEMEERGVWIMGDAGAAVKLHSREWTHTEEPASRPRPASA